MALLPGSSEAGLGTVFDEFILSTITEVQKVLHSVARQGSLLGSV